MTKASSSFDHDLNQPSTFDHVVAASRRRLFAVFYEPADGLEAVAALPSEDLIPGEQTWLFHGQEGVRRLDASGVGHGAYGPVGSHAADHLGRR